MVTTGIPPMINATFHYELRGADMSEDILKHLHYVLPFQRKSYQKEIQDIDELFHEYKYNR